MRTLTDIADELRQTPTGAIADELVAMGERITAARVAFSAALDSVLAEPLNLELMHCAADELIAVLAQAV